MGYEIPVFTSLSQLDQCVGGILFLGGVHGDEPEGVNLANSLLQWASSVSEKPVPQNSSQSAFATQFCLVPCLNVDGYRTNQRTNSNGVDINRNYPASNWTHSSVKNRYYSGDAPASEAETQLVVWLISQLRPQVVIHFHSWKPCIVCTGDGAQNIGRILQPDDQYPIVSSIGYDTPGSLSCYGWVDHQIPVICIEEYEKAEAKDTWQRFGPGLKKLLLA